MNTTTTATGKAGIEVGARVGVRGAYRMEYRARVADEWTGLFGTVVRVDGRDALVEVDGTGSEVWLATTRLVPAPDDVDPFDLACAMNPDRDW